MWLHLTLVQIQVLISSYGYVLLFPISVLEGPIVSAIAGILVATGQLNWFIVFWVLLAGDLVGDIAYYSLGRYGHGPLMRGIVKWLGFNEARVRPLQEGFAHHDWKIILIGKTQAFGSVILYFAGAFRMPVGRFLMWNLIGSVPKVILFEAIGYFFGTSLTQTSKYIDYIGITAFILAIVLLGSYWYFAKYLTKRLEEVAKES